MSVRIPYEKQTLDHPNLLARFAHRSRFARSKSVVLAELEDGSVLADYGCGQGRFLSELNTELKSQKKSCKLLGYDPYMSCKFDGYIVVSDVDEIACQSANVITCLETCEHLDDEELAK
ncbi:methyltransferase domain-containing protein [Planctomicrobium sp. SH661]|uniref:methyltransferase domain-containing protein n=1 Tax=Planctomicrobium sp. SH661 TaxID=3448124 RepID=UPI003F5BCDAF